MQALVFAVLFSVAVSVLLKLAQRGNFIMGQAVAFNYVVASALTYVFLKPTFNGQSLQIFLLQSPEMPLIILMGLVLPSLFIIMYRAIVYAGITRADAAQRLSLFLPIVAAFVIFGEKATQNKLIGVGLAFLALICLMIRPNAKNHQNSAENSGPAVSLKGGFKAMLALFLVWLGYGIVDILFKNIAKMGGVFPNTLFLAFVLAGCFMFIYLVLTRTVWTMFSVLVGLLLGALNFGNILFYIKAHQALSQDPTLVFAGMNIGVISLATIVGGLFFRERLSKINLLGLVLGVAAIVCLFYYAAL